MDNEGIKVTHRDVVLRNTKKFEISAKFEASEDVSRKDVIEKLEELINEVAE